MEMNGWFGNLSIWLMLGAAWVAIAIVTGTVFAVIARVGRGGGEK